MELLDRRSRGRQVLPEARFLVDFVNVPQRPQPRPFQEDASASGEVSEGFFIAGERTRVHDSYFTMERRYGGISA